MLVLVWEVEEIAGCGVSQLVGDGGKLMSRDVEVNLMEAE